MNETTPDLCGPIACRMCGGETWQLGTKLCDRCWELERRIERDPELARKILARVSESAGYIVIENDPFGPSSVYRGRFATLDEATECTRSLGHDRFELWEVRPVVLTGGK